MKNRIFEGGDVVDEVSGEISLADGLIEQSPELSLEGIKKVLTVLHDRRFEHWQVVAQALIPDFAFKKQILQSEDLSIFPVVDAINALDFLKLMQFQSEDQKFTRVFEMYFLKFSLSEAISKEELESRLARISCHMAHDFELPSAVSEHPEWQNLVLATSNVSRSDAEWSVMGSEDETLFQDGKIRSGVHFLAVAEPSFFEEMAEK